jgi:hypothetical protein
VLSWAPVLCHLRRVDPRQPHLRSPGHTSQRVETPTLLHDTSQGKGQVVQRALRPAPPTSSVSSESRPVVPRLPNRLTTGVCLHLKVSPSVIFTTSALITGRCRRRRCVRAWQVGDPL